MNRLSVPTLTILLIGFMFMPLQAFSQDTLNRLEDWISNLEDKLDEVTDKIEIYFDEKASDLDSDYNDDREMEEYKRALELQRRELERKVDKLKRKLRDLDRQKSIKTDIEEELSDLESEIYEIEQDIYDPEIRGDVFNIPDVVVLNPPPSPTPDPDGKTNRYSQSTTIQAGNIVNGDVIVTNGDLTVEGMIVGDAVAVTGDVIIKSTGTIDGDAVSIGGSVIKETGATITGTISEVSSDVASVESEFRRQRVDNGDRVSSYDRIYAKDLDQRWTDDRFIDDSEGQVSYNRVDGFYLGVGRQKDYHWNSSKRLSIHGFLGYSFGNKNLQYQGSVDRWFNTKYRTEIGISAYDYTRARDPWKISEHENAGLAFFTREDFLDYYQARGILIHFTQFFTPSARIRVEYSTEEHFSLQNEVQWSVFGGDKLFRLNPEIQEGEVKALTLSGELDQVDQFDRYPSGYYLKGTAELAGGQFQGDYEYNRYYFDARAYVNLSRYDNLRIRLLLGSSYGMLPVQKTFEIGGIGSLQGYKQNEFAGNRMGLFRIENILSSPELRDELPGPWENLNLILFTELGYTNFAPSYYDAWEGFNATWGNLKNSVGFGFVDDDDDFRLTFGWRTDTGSKPVQIMVRFNRPF